MGDKGIIVEGKAFQYWYFKNIWGFEDDLVEEIDTDDSQDQGIDAIYLDDAKNVHFFQFKNISNINKNFPQKEAEATLNGIRLLQQGNYESFTNEKLKNQFQEIMTHIRKHYFIHYVSSALGLAYDAKKIIDSHIESLNMVGQKFSYDETDINSLEIEHSRKLRFRTPEAIEFKNVDAPFLQKIQNIFVIIIMA